MSTRSTKSTKFQFLGKLNPWKHAEQAATVSERRRSRAAKLLITAALASCFLFPQVSRGDSTVTSYVVTLHDGRSFSFDDLQRAQDYVNQINANPAWHASLTATESATDFRNVDSQGSGDESQDAANEAVVEDSADDASDSSSTPIADSASQYQVTLHDGRQFPFSNLDAAQTYMSQINANPNWSATLAKIPSVRKPSVSSMTSKAQSIARKSIPPQNRKRLTVSKLSSTSQISRPTINLAPIHRQSVPQARVNQPSFTTAPIRRPTQMTRPPAQAYRQPTPVYRPSTPVYRQSAPVYRQPTATYRQSAPVYRQPTPSYRPSVQSYRSPSNYARRR